MHPSLRFGMRASKMAVTAGLHARALINGIAPNIPIDMVHFVSQGDLTQGDLANAGGKGLFIKDLEQRLLSGEIDFALHTLKDVPGDVPMHPDLTLVSFLTREDPRDALVLRHGVRERDLRGGVIGTSAPRRRAILKKLYPGVTTVICRGNVDTRIRHLDDGRFDAIVVSAAGLERLGLESRIARRYDTSEMLPAVGQGIVCLQVRKADVARCTFLRLVNDEWSETAAVAERAVLSGLRGNCHSAIAAHLSREGTKVVLEAEVMESRGETQLWTRHEAEADGVDVESLGRFAVAGLLEQGAASLL